MADVEIGVHEAALRLGVSDRRIRALLHERVLAGRKAGGAWHVDAHDVARLAGQSRRPGRRMVPVRAWAALLLLAGETLFGDLSNVARSQVRRTVRERADADPADWRVMLADRCDVLPVRAHPAAIRRLFGHPNVAAAGIEAAVRLGADLVAVDPLPEAYVDRIDWHHLGSDLLLDLAPSRYDAQVLVHVPRISLPVPVRDIADAGGNVWSLMLALDLMDDPDVRVQRAGYDLWNRVAHAPAAADGSVAKDGSRAP